MHYHPTCALSSSPTPPLCLPRRLLLFASFSPPPTPPPSLCLLFSASFSCFFSFLPSLASFSFLPSLFFILFSSFSFLPSLFFLLFSSFSFLHSLCFILSASSLFFFLSASFSWLLSLLLSLGFFLLLAICWEGRGGRVGGGSGWAGERLGGNKKGVSEETPFQI